MLKRDFRGQGINRETCQEAIAIIQVKGDGGKSGRWSGPGYMLKVQAIIFSYG